MLESNPAVNAHERSESRLLIIFPGALGDLICLIPAIRWIATQNPQSRVDLMARMELARFAVGRIGIARAHSIDRLEVGQLFADGEIDRSRASAFFSAFERIDSFFAADNDRFKANLSSVAQEMRFYPFRPPGAGHVADAYQAAVGASKDSKASTKIELLDTDWAVASEILGQFGLQQGKYLLVLPGSGSRLKNWPIEHFVQLGQRMKQALRSLVILGPAEEGLADAFRAAGLAVVGDIELGTVAALANGARAFVGNDSGVSHLAAASGARGLVLFGPTDPTRWRPRGPIEIIRHQPLAELAVEDVEAALEAILCDD